MNKIFVILTIFLTIVGFSEPQKKKKSGKKKKSASLTINKKDTQIKSEHLFVNGMRYFLIGEYDKAIDNFKAANNLTPDQAGIHFKLADAYFKEGVKSQSILHLKKAIELNENNKAYYFLLADVYKSEFQFKEAAETYKVMIQHVPSTEDFNIDLAKIYFYLGMNDKSGASAKEKNEYLNQALEAYDKSEEVLGTIDEIIRDKQQIYLKQNKLDKAIQEGEKLIKKNPKDLNHRIRLAELKYRNDRRKEAIEDLEKAVEINPNKSGLARIHLFEYYEQEDKAKSFEHLKEAFKLEELGIELKVRILEQYYYQKMNDEAYKAQALVLSDILSTKYSDKAISHAVHGDILYLSDNKEEARNAYISSLGLDNSKLIVWEQVVRLETDLQEGDSVVKHADDAIELFPNQPSLWLYKGIGHMILKDNEQAVLAFEKGKKMNLGNQELEGFFNAQLGDGYNGLKEYDKADKAYDEALSADPDNAHVLNNYSYYLSLRKEKLKKALTMSERLIELHPNESTYLDTYGWVLYISEDYEKAEEFLKKAVDETNNGTIFEHYGDVLYKLNRLDEALNFWQKAKDAGDTTELIDKKIADKKLYEEE